MAECELVEWKPDGSAALFEEISAVILRHVDDGITANQIADVLLTSFMFHAINAFGERQTRDALKTASTKVRAYKREIDATLDRGLN